MTTELPLLQNNELLPDDIPEIIIKPTHGWGTLGLHDVWEYRELLYFLVTREVKGRYRQMAFGPLWIILVPLIQMLLFTFIFGQLAQLPSEGIPYPIFTYVALLPWQFFATATRNASGSLVQQKNIITKVYFPRLIIPLAGIIAAFIDFLASFSILILMMFIFRVQPTWAILTLPLFIIVTAMAALAVGLWLACLAVKFHDVNLGVSFGIDIWKYLTPVAYSATLIPEQWQWLYRLNPMAGVVEGFRWALLGTGRGPDVLMLISTIVIIILLVTGAYYFRRTERTIVDLV